jgi:hypothetical protein
MGRAAGRPGQACRTAIQIRFETRSIQTDLDGLNRCFA